MNVTGLSTRADRPYPSKAGPCMLDLYKSRRCELGAPGVAHGTE